MKKHTEDQSKKENKSYLELNPVAQINKAKEAVKKGKAQDAKKIAAGKKWVVLDNRTRVLR